MQSFRNQILPPKYRGHVVAFVTEEEFHEIIAVVTIQ